MAGKQRVEWCSCGRRAVQVLTGPNFGPTGYCGVPGNLPVQPCECGLGAAHDRAVCHIYGVGLARQQQQEETGDPVQQ